MPIYERNRPRANSSSDGRYNLQFNVNLNKCEIHFRNFNGGPVHKIMVANRVYLNFMGIFMDTPEKNTAGTKSSESDTLTMQLLKFHICSFAV